MRTLRLISTTAAILLLGAGVVSAQGMKTERDARRSGGTAECTGGEYGTGCEIRPNQNARKNRASGTDSARIRQQAADDG